MHGGTMYHGTWHHLYPAGSIYPVLGTPQTPAGWPEGHPRAPGESPRTPPSTSEGSNSHFCPKRAFSHFLPLLEKVDKSHALPFVTLSPCFPWKQASSGQKGRFLGGGRLALPRKVLKNLPPHLSCGAFNPKCETHSPAVSGLLPPPPLAFDSSG